MRYLHEQDYKLKVRRPWPLKQDEELREAFSVKLRAWQQDPQTDVWFCDESGFEGDPRRGVTGRRSARCVSRPT